LNTPRSPLVVTADKAYDSQTARQQIKDEGALPITDLLLLSRAGRRKRSEMANLKLTFHLAHCSRAVVRFVGLLQISFDPFQVPIECDHL
jgi:hypothetical protein